MEVQRFAAAFIAIALIVGLAYLANRKIPHTNTINPLYHFLYVAFAAAIIFFLPAQISADVFSPVGVIAVTAVFPTYESIRAVCTLETSDDTSWLQYWVISGILSFSTEFVSDIIHHNFETTEIWYQFEFFFSLWLLLPFTNASYFIYVYVTEPILRPYIEPVAEKMGNLYQKVVMMFVNVSHLWVVWIAFALLPASFKRFVVVTVGTVYPVTASMVAISTPVGVDDTMWLTYWSCFSCLFIMIDFLENFLGKIPGFYTLALFCTVYLMLPLFNGADNVFRSILVPLAGLQEMLLQRDADLLKQSMIEQIPESKRKEFFKVISKKFSEDDTQEKFQSTFGWRKKKSDGGTSEDTPLIV